MDSGYICALVPDDTPTCGHRERLFSSSLVVVVSHTKPRQMNVYHFKKGTEICNYSYSGNILSIRLNRQVGGGSRGRGVASSGRQTEERRLSMTVTAGTCSAGFKSQPRLSLLYEPSRCGRTSPAPPVCCTFLNVGRAG